MESMSRGEKKKGEKKKGTENNGLNISKFDENYKPSDPRSSMNTKII